VTTGAPHPEKIGKYEVERVLGRGAMGVVYLARDPMIGRNVAIKTVLLPPGLEPEKVQEFRQRFLREARAAGQMSHPAIVTIYEADDGSAGGPPFIAMEFIQGDTWSARIKRGEKSEANVLLHQIQQVASALAYAHAARVVHRDIKPANIITTAEGRAKLMDFGIARVPTSELTQEGQFLGTPAYMSPEQILGRGVDGRSDLFSLGTVMFEMLTGVKPFAGEEITVVTHKILQEPPEPLPEKNASIPDEVGWILNHLLAKDPANRYQSAKELEEDIQAYFSGALPPHASQGGAAERTMVSKEEIPSPMAPPLEAPPKPDSPLSTQNGRPVPPPPPPSPSPVPPPSPPAAGAAPPAPPAPPLPSPPGAAGKAGASPSPGKGRSRLLLILAIVVVGGLVVVGAAGGFLWWWTHRVALPVDTPESPSLTQAEPGPGPEVSPPPPDTPATAPTDLGTPTAPSLQPAGSTTVAPKPKPRPKPPAGTGTPAAPPAGTGTTTLPTPVAAAAPQGDCTLEYTFTAGVLRGEYWIKVDGQTVAHEKIDRKFTLKAGQWSGSARVSSGSRTVTFELLTEIQDIKTTHDERAEFAPGETRHLDVRLTKMKKALEFEWR